MLQLHTINFLDIALINECGARVESGSLSTFAQHLRNTVSKYRWCDSFPLTKGFAEMKFVAVAAGLSDYAQRMICIGQVAFGVLHPDGGQIVFGREVDVLQE